MKDAGKTAEVKVYPPYGTSASAGHTVACLGSPVGSDDVFSFLTQHGKQ